MLVVERAACGSRSRVAAMLLAGMAVVGGCDVFGGRAEEAEGVSRETFVEVVVALREAERSLPADSTAVERFAERRDSILARHGVSEGDLQAFVRAREEDLAGLQAVWDTINERLKYVPPSRGEDDALPGPRVQ